MFLFRFAKKLWNIVRDLYGRYRLRMLLLAVLGMLGSFLEGVGVTILIPLFAFFAGGGSQTSNIAVSMLEKVLRAASINPGFQVMLGVVVVLFVLKAGVLFCFGWVRAKTVANFRMEMRKLLYKRFLQADFAYLQKQKVGHLNVVITGEVKTSSKLFENLLSVILSLGSIVTYAAVAAFVSWSVTILSLLAGAIFLYAFKPFFRKLRGYARTLIENGKKVAHHLAQVLYGIKTIKAMGVEKQVFNEVLPIFKEVEKVEFRKQVTKHIAKVSLEPATILFVVGMFAVSYFYLKFNAASFIAVMYLIHQIFTHVEKLQSALYIMSESLPSAYIVLKTVRETVRHQTISEGERPFIFKKRIRFENISFSYNSGGAVVKNLNFFLGKGEAVGIIGPSGVGKTTIVDLLLRLHLPTDGVIWLDDIEARETSLKDWRANVVYVPQDVFLMNASVSDNIRFYDFGSSDLDVAEAAKSADIFEFVTSLPDGFNTRVGERGARFSGGERQRIALARALIKKPSILILDEATSALDAHSEGMVKETLKKLKGKVTLVIIAHKPSTIDYVDRVIAMREGRVVEEGSPSALLAKEDSYFRAVYDKGSSLVEAT